METQSRGGEEWNKGMEGRCGRFRAEMGNKASKDERGEWGERKGRDWFRIKC